MGQGEQDDWDDQGRIFLVGNFFWNFFWNIFDGIFSAGNFQ